MIPEFNKEVSSKIMENSNYQKITETWIIENS